MDVTNQEIGLYFLSCSPYVAILGIIYGGIQSFKFHRIFYEQDPRWSNYRTLEDTVSDAALHSINILLVLFSIAFMVFCCLDRKLENIRNAEKWKEVAILIISYGTALAVTSLITGIMKILFTEPRPAMFYLCNYQGFKDAVDSGNFTSYLLLTDPNRVGNTANCWDQNGVPECIHAFPSGHASISFCSMFWLVLFYLDVVKRPVFAWTKYYRFVLWFPLLIAFYIAYSRVYDYKHSELDILTGCLIGIGCAYYYFNEYIEFFRSEKAKQKPMAELSELP